MPDSSQLEQLAQLALKEQAKRDARKSLVSFTEYRFPNYRAAHHHRAIAEKLEAVERGEIKRLMICMPPRHGKTELASKSFPAWFLGRNPDKQIIAASYNGDIASDFGREVRNIVSSPEYRELFDVKLSADSQAADRWHTEQGGVYVAAGVGTAITGRGAHILLIDDPFKDREEADSEIRRKRVWEWFISTAFTRQMPGGAIVIINTRWHEDDLSGRLLAQDAEKWDLLSLPAIDGEGNALWPEWYPLEDLEARRKVIGPREWSALYQQDPTPDDGEYFKRDWFAEYETTPEGLSLYGASDYAVTDGGGDYTEHGIFGIDQQSNIYVIDWWYGKTAPDQWIDRKCDLILKHRPLRWFGESGVIRKSVEPFMVRRMTERNAYCWVEWLPSISDKASRARAIQARASMGKVWLPKKAAWKDHVLTQLLKFPAGKHDDAVDVMSLIGRGLEYVADARPRRTHVPAQENRFAWMG